MNQSAAAIAVEIQSELSEGYAEAGEVDEAQLQQAVQFVAEAEGLAGPAEMSLVLTDDERMQELNRSYSNVDATTDVLSFAASDDAGAGFVAAPAIDEPRFLGDVIISLPQAGRQAVERGHSLAAELCLLVVHGTLHLLGHDHAEPEERARMWATQRTVLRRLGCEHAAPEE